MGLARLAVIGMIALTTTMQTGWGQGGQKEAASVQRVDGTAWLDIDFPGGTYQDLVDAIKAKQPRANILLEPDAAVWQVPAFEAFGVTPAGALELARNMLPEPNHVLVSAVRLHGDDSAPATAVRLHQVVKERENASGPDAHEPRAAENAATRAWNLKAFVGSRGDTSGILAAIQTGVESYRYPPLMRYHEPTGVLMVRGATYQIEFIDSIITAASMTADVHIADPGHFRAQIESIETMLVDNDGKLSVLDARKNLAMRNLGEASTGGEDASARAAAIRVEIAEIGAEQNLLLLQRERLKANLEANRQALKSATDN